MIVERHWFQDRNNVLKQSYFCKKNFLKMDENVLLQGEVMQFLC